MRRQEWEKREGPRLRGLGVGIEGILIGLVTGDDIIRAGFEVNLFGHKSRDAEMVLIPGSHSDVLWAASQSPHRRYLQRLATVW